MEMTDTIYDLFFHAEIHRDGPDIWMCVMCVSSPSL